MLRKYITPLLLLLATLTLLTACNRGKLDETETLPVEKLYGEAKSSLENGNYSRAKRYYQRLISRFPFGEYTEQAEMEMAYAQYKSYDYEEALSTTNRFVRQYPTNQHVNYVYYLRGLINFNRNQSFLNRFITQDKTRNDLTYAKQSFQDFGELIQRYPNSRYAEDARQRMQQLRNGLAQAELNVAHYYLRRKAYIAAQHRAKTIIEDYPQALQTGDALAILTECYHQLKQTTLAEDTLRVLKLNYPNHPYLSGDWPKGRKMWWQLVPLVGENKAG